MAGENCRDISAQTSCHRAVVQPAVGGGPCLLPPCPPTSASSPSPVMSFPHLRCVRLLGLVLGCLLWISDSAGSLSKQCDPTLSATTPHTALGVRANSCPLASELLTSFSLRRSQASEPFLAAPPPHPHPLAPPCRAWMDQGSRGSARQGSECPALMCDSSCSLLG